MADLSEGLGIVTAWEAVSLASNRHRSGFFARVHAPALHQMAKEWYAVKVDELGHVFGLQRNSSANSVQLPDNGKQQCAWHHKLTSALQRFQGLVSSDTP